MDPKEDTVIFDKLRPNVFYTEKEAFFLAKYEINPSIMEALKLN